MSLTVKVIEACGCTWFEGTTPEAVAAVHKAVPTWGGNWIKSGVRFNTEYGVEKVETALIAAGLTLVPEA